MIKKNLKLFWTELGFLGQDTSKFKQVKQAMGKKIPKTILQSKLSPTIIATYHCIISNIKPKN